MYISFKDSGEARKMEADGTIEKLLKGLKICTESVLVKRNGKFVPVEEKLRYRDEIEIIRITSSG